MKVGVLELVAYTVPPEWRRQPAAAAMRKLLYCVMPQTVAAWCWRLGHRTHYATYYGHADPLACYCAPYLVTTLKHYDPVAFYRHLARIQGAITSWAALLRRVASPAPGAVRLAHAVQTLLFRELAQQTRAILSRLEKDRGFRAFHDGEWVPLPEFYRRHFRQRLGRYAELISAADRTPILDRVLGPKGGKTGRAPVLSEPPRGSHSLSD
jgi:hypothetical protein